MFADLARVRGAWRPALEGWNVLQSEQVLEWQAMARVATTRDNLLRLLHLRFPVALPQDLLALIQATTDLDKLARWFDAAATAPSLEAVRAAVQL